MWPTAAVNGGACRRELVAILLIVPLLRHPPAVRADCALLSSESYAIGVRETQLFGMSFKSPELSGPCRGQPSEYRLAIEASPGAGLAAACAQFRASVDPLQGSDNLIPNVRVDRALDYERPELRVCEGRLVLYSTRANEALSSQSLLIVVNDANDNPPQFDRRAFAFEVDENDQSPVRFTLPVGDRDSSANAKFNFSVASVSCARAGRQSPALNASYCRTRFDQLFRLETHTAPSSASENAASAEKSGALVVLASDGRALDHEDVSSWRLVVRVNDEAVVASDGGKSTRQSDEANVTIDVRDRPEPPAVRYSLKYVTLDYVTFTLRSATTALFLRHRA